MSDLKTACITFLGNPYLDSRVVNLIDSLKANNVNVKVIAFDWQTPDFVTVKGDVTIYKLTKQKFSALFYIKFLFLLFKALRKVKADYYFAEDIYVLPATSFFAKRRKAKLYYNSRELYSHIGGLKDKRSIQMLISLVEKFYINKPDYVLVTGELDAEYLTHIYGITNTLLLRNLPKFNKQSKKIDFRSRFNIPEKSLILLYQGVLLKGRGISLMLKALRELEDTVFIVIGEGVYRKDFEMEAEELGVTDKVFFLGTVEHERLLQYTAGADVGIALIENISLSYFYALPNKLFEYIMAEVPVLVTNLPQMKAIVDDYRVGEYITNEEPGEIVEIIKKWQTNPAILKIYKDNCVEASTELNWQVEFDKIKHLLLT